MKKLRVGVTGAKGNVGIELVKLGCTPLECDITDYDSVYRELKHKKIELVIHCAALTNVEYCEEHEKEAFSVNCVGTNCVITACEILNIKMIYISTDHVFDGKRWFGNYKESDNPNPINVYGFTKLGGEGLALLSSDNIKIVRTSYLLPRDYRKIFYVQEMLKKDNVEIPTFIKRTFLHVEHFAIGLEYVADSFDSMPKILHVSGTKKMSWYDWVKSLHNRPVKKRNKYLSDGFAPRPQNGGLDTSLAKKLGVPLFSA